MSTPSPSEAPAGASYRDRAEEQMDFIQSRLFDADAGRYRPHDPALPGDLPYAFMWDNGIQLRALVDAAYADPAKYGPPRDAFADAVWRFYWDPAPVGSPPGFNAYCSGPGGDDKYYDDNAWLVLAFLEAHAQTQDPKYLAWAKETQAFVLSGADDVLGGGIYWYLTHAEKNTCVTAPTSVAALGLAAVDPEGDQREWAGRLRDWTKANLRDADGLYWDHVKLDGRVEKTKWTYNTGLMIESDVLWFQQTGDPDALASAQQSAASALAYWQDPATGRLRDAPKFTHLLCQSLLRLYEVDGNAGLLDAVRRYVSHGLRHGRDAEGGGYWSDWGADSHEPGKAKALLENAGVARLLWLVAPYPTPEALYAQGLAAEARGDSEAAADLFRQAAASDAEAADARTALARVQAD